LKEETMSEPSAFEGFEASCRALRPEVFIILGSGMGPLVERVALAATVSFANVPDLASSSVVGHRGRLLLGRWSGQTVLVAEGRLHFYEGHSWEVVVRPIRLAAQFGVRAAVLTNAAGGIRDDLGPGSLLPLRDQIEWNQPWSWRERRPSPYSQGLLKRIVEGGGVSPPGVYAAVSGPSYETPAEIRALRAVGADAVGMSTSREARAGVEAGLEVAALSLITNRAAGLSDATLDHQEVLATARAAADRLADVIERLVARL
jgi:purine-nucleoside phosphorylase